MTCHDGNKTTPGKSTVTEESPLDMTFESEGGFLCGEFLLDEEDVAAEPKKTL